MIGQKLGRYEILAKLGAGGMGEVYRARDLTLGREIALKILPERVRHDPDRLRRFEQEARSASALNHPNIVTIHDIGQSDGVPYIAMELVEGHTLRSLLGHRPFVTKRALALAAQAADGLAKAHAAGIVHRDLKPENLMVTQDGFLKILDFGLAKLHEAEPLLASDAPTEAGTRPGVLLGTVGYMSPEQVRGKAVDFRSDQFAYGAILYEMATGRRAFNKETAAQTLSAILESEPEPILNLNPEAPAPFRWIVERCLKKGPEERYASTLDLARELRNVHDRLEEVSRGSASGTGPLPVAGLASPAWLRPAGLVAALAVLVGLWIGMIRQPERPPSVAVLKIQNLGAQPADDYLSVAIADAVMTRLAAIPSLTVVDRSTLRDLVATTDLKKVARDLGVSYLVTGAMQRAESRLKLTVKLVDSSSSVVWGEQYDGSTDDLFGLQARIAQGLSDALKLRLTADQRQRLERPPTKNAEAYADYLQARAFLERPDVAENVDRGISIFERAIAKDPSFALAQAGLGEAYWEKYQATKDPVWAAKAQGTILEALRLDPDLPQVRVSLALVHQGTGHLDAAIEELRRAIATRPDSDDAHRQLGLVLETKGRKEEALPELQMAVALRPAYWRNHSQLGNAYFRMGRYDDAIASFKRVTELQPDNSRGFQMLGAAHQMKGDAAQALENYRRSIAITPDARAYSNMVKLLYDQRRYPEAANAAQASIKLEPTPTKFRNLGDTYRKMGQEAEARASYERAVQLAEELLRVNPKNALELANLAVAQAKLGRLGDALKRAAEAVRLSPKDGEVLYKQAVVAALAGDASQALESLERSLAQGYSESVARGDDDLSSLRGHARFKKLLALGS